MFLDQNIKGLCSKYGVEFSDFLGDFGVENTKELSLFDLEAICEENTIDLHSILFKPIFKSNTLKSQLDKIKLLILDVDGVMTDGGMYFTENGDQIKKFNTKDGMAIIHLTKSDFQIAILSSGFTNNMVQERAKLLGIQKCYVGRNKKIEVLEAYCKELSISFENVAIIGDDINDLDIIKKVGFSACPSDAMDVVKTNVDVILNKKGGEGCVREFIDAYILNEPLS
jgi:3-deoxy-D-manno-octulosonate 8-phosphate phosphatase (KDO 8-P phosphatase)